MSQRASVSASIISLATRADGAMSHMELFNSEMVDIEMKRGIW
jgi:hypothetical protein